LTVGLMVASWIWELNRWMQRRQKNAADQYNNRVVELITAAQGVESETSLHEIWRELLAILTSAVRDLDADRMSQESFNSFRSILQIGLEVLKERRSLPGSTADVTVTAAHDAAGAQLRWTAMRSKPDRPDPFR